MDEAAQELIRTARINITELELLEFDDASGDCGMNKRTASMTAGDRGASQSASSDASRRINVTDNSALGLPRATVRMACSKGTYVRAFARDLGEALGSGAHLDSLQRSRSGIFKVEDSMSIEDVIMIFHHPDRGA